MLVLPLPLAAQAATPPAAVHVVSQDGGGDFDTVGGAVAAAGDGDVIVIHPGTYREQGLALSRSLQVVGVIADGDRPVLESSSPEGFFDVSGASVTLRDLRFVGAGEGGRSRGVVQSGGALEVQGCVFEGHHAVFADELGAAIRVDGGALTVRHTVFDDNRAWFGGHLSLGPDASAVVERSVLTRGEAWVSGGAITTTIGAALTVRFSELSDNRAANTGGGIGSDGDRNTAAVTVTDSVFARNVVQSGGGDGGAVYLNEALLHRVERTLFCDNFANQRGGAIHANGGELEVVDSAFVANATPGGGGAIRGGRGPITVRGGTFVANEGAEGQAMNSGESVVEVSTSAFVEHALATPLFSSPDFSILLQDRIVIFGSGNLGQYDPEGEVIQADPLLPVPEDPCDPRALVPGDGSVLWGTGGEANVGAIADRDGDGYYALIDDCDDGDGDVHPGATEVVADGVDQDCDGFELCRADADGDGLGEVQVVASYDPDCGDHGEAATDDDPCLGSGPDQDGDRVCDEHDVCAGADDLLDRDGDGLPDGCDPCPDDPAASCEAPPEDRAGGTIPADGHPPGCGCAGSPAGPGGWIPFGLALAGYRAYRRASHRSGRAHAAR